MGTRPKYERKSTRVEMGFLEAVRRRCPGQKRVLEVLGDLYTRVGRYEEGLQVDRELARLMPDEPVAWYNLGCSLALVGRKEEALETLGKAVDLGYADGDWMRRDPDLGSLHGDTVFEELARRAHAGARRGSPS